MLADALAQFLLARKWPHVLVLRGPLPEDKADADAFAHAAKRFGLTIAATRDFIVSNDPRHRDQDNIALLTGDASYDIVYVADNDGTFARTSALRYDRSAAGDRRHRAGADGVDLDLGPLRRAASQPSLQKARRSRNDATSTGRRGLRCAPSTMPCEKAMGPQPKRWTTIYWARR